MTDDRIKITCSNNDRVADAKIVQRGLKRLVVSMSMGASSVEIILTRDEVTKPFVGRLAGMEFTSPANS